MNTPQTWSDSPIHEQIRTMNDTPTPRTDAELFLSRGMGITPTLPKEVVRAVFSKTLERELAAVTEQRDAVTLRLGRTQEKMFDAERQRDRLAEALQACREDSVELLGERCFWQNEPRCDYDKRYQETRNNVTRADEALQSLTPNEL
jgi:hypothetical protein